MAQHRSLGILFVLACGLVAGCSDASREAGTSSSGDGAGGGDRDDEEGGSDGEVDGDGGDGDAGPTPACVRYLDCIAAVNPALLSDAEDSVGEDGACWDGDAARRESCDQGCVTGLADARVGSPGEVRCHECAGDEYCGDGRCVGEGADRFCAECRDDADCAGGRCGALFTCVGGGGAGGGGEPDAAACLERTMSVWESVGGFDRACFEPCTSSMAAACTAVELCCMTDPAMAAECDGEYDCVTETCRPSQSCLDGIAATGACIEDC